MIYKFKKGNRVRCIALQDNNQEIIGKVGVIIQIGISSCSGKQVYVVEFVDKIPRGHNGHCLPPGKDGHCWNIIEVNLELEESKIIEVYGIVKFLKQYDKV